MTRAQKIQKRAARVGFDWTELRGVLAKVHEEIAELEAELEAGSVDRLEDEIGDLFFSLVNLSRHLKLDAETSLRRATAKFEQRFSRMERMIEAEGAQFEDLSAETLDGFWNRAKAADR